ncbi:MAG: hypothetical protein B6245_09310 [Desulfobacteraceae bacterium 4572_88]|nr:MAG: hypothetical protein B6245_09310 [Desulfobacteraceae bacterium 4572_88]
MSVRFQAKIEKSVYFTRIAQFRINFRSFAVFSEGDFPFSGYLYNLTKSALQYSFCPENG